MSAIPIEIKVGNEVVWKDGAPGPAYAKYECQAQGDETDGFIYFFGGEVNGGIDKQALTYSLTYGGYDLMRSRSTGARIINLLPGSQRFFVGGKDGDELRVDDYRSIYDFPTGPIVGLDINYSGGISFRFDGGGRHTISYSALFDGANTESGYFPDGFPTYGGEGPEPEESNNFWTNFRNCYETGVGP